jgi:hypothetical protein
LSFFAAQICRSLPLKVVTVPGTKTALMTIGEVAARVRHLAADPFAVTERCRHWAKLGLLVSADRHAEGTGRHKLYDERAVYDAAVLIILADVGVGPGRHQLEPGFKPKSLQIKEETRWVADVQHWARQALRNWSAEDQTRPVYLEVFFIPGGKYYVEIHHGTPKPSQEIAKRSGLDDPAEARAASSFRFDLAWIFESVSATAEEDGEESAVA